MLQVCGSTDCCLSRSLDDDGHVDWLPGQTDTFAGEGSAEKIRFYFSFMFPQLGLCWNVPAMRLERLHSL